MNKFSGKRILLSLFISVLVGCFVVTAQAESVNFLTISKDVIEATADNPFGNFVNYRVEGMCFWLDWSSVGPYVKTTLKVNEFLPDAVMTVYNGYGQDPWTFAKIFVDPVTHKLGDTQEETINGYKTSYGTSSAGGNNDMSEKYKEVDIIGDPALLAFFSLLPLPLIQSQAVSFKPYYSSLADAYLWRNPALDDTLHPEAWLPGVRVVGGLIDQWGPIFPRMGYIDQPGDYKAASVLALRAADIATHRAQSHVYIPLASGSCGHECHVWPSHENDFTNVKYQEIYPRSSIKAKKNFGVNGLFSGIGPYGQDQYAQSKGNYVFVMWRHYEGCIQSSGQFLGST